LIDLSPVHLGTVKGILRDHVPGDKVYAFGSRVNGRAKPFSDLDLVVKSEKPLNLEKLGELRWAFSDSDLPIKVDVVDWTGLEESFRKMIAKELSPVYP